jgi:hypothetical protein
MPSEEGLQCLLDGLLAVERCIAQQGR